MRRPFAVDLNSAAHSVRLQGGFTLIELLIVVVVIGVLMAIAVPSYVGLRARAADAAAKSNIRATVTAAEAFALDNDGVKTDVDKKANTIGYKGMTVALLRANYDAGIAATVTILASKTTATQYCITDTQGTSGWSALGPGIASSSFKNNVKCK